MSTISFKIKHPVHNIRKVPSFQVSCSSVFSLVRHKELSRIFTAYLAFHSGFFQIEKHWNRNIASKSISVKMVCFCTLFD